MKQNKRIVYILFLICILSCKQEKPIATGQTESGLYIIDIDAVSTKEKIKLSDYFSKAKIIPLETSEKCLIGDIGGVQVTDEYLFVLDTHTAKTIFMFNKQGRFIRKIGSVGIGPDQYASVSDFTLDQKNNVIYLMDTNGSKILKYNYNTGAFISAIPFHNNQGLARFIQYHDGKLYTDMFFHNVKQKEKYMLQEIDLSSGEVIKTWINPDIYNKGVHEESFMNESFFYSRNQGSPKYMQSLMDTVLSLQDNEVKAYLAIKDKLWVTPEDVERIKKTDSDNPVPFITSRFFTQNKSYNIFNFVEVKDLIFFRFVRNQKFYTVLYNINTNQLNVTTNLQNDLVYKDAFSLMENVACADDKGIYTYLDSEMLPYFMEQKEKGNVKSNINAKGILDKIGEDPNPVIFYYESK
ncbi:MAG: 6-bladed beta-propeller [Prevotella sp.]|jgi:hypothetical protein|nr:6-bladed beta-propeller [Prevotella sp.]